jgi:hypothetical protein
MPAKQMPYGPLRGEAPWRKESTPKGKSPVMAVEPAVTRMALCMG